MRQCARSADPYADIVGAIHVPEGFDSDELTNHALETYGVSFDVGLGGLAAIEMAMVDLNYPIELGQV